MSISDTHAGQNSSAAGASPISGTPAGFISDSLVKAVDEALTASPGDVRGALTDNIDSIDDGVVGKNPDDLYGGSDKPKNRFASAQPGGSAAGQGSAPTDADQASMQNVLKVAEKQDRTTYLAVVAAGTTFDLARRTNTRAENRAFATAQFALAAARGAWTTASEDCTFAAEGAMVTLQAALNVAAGTCTSKHNRDSQSRDQVIYHTMETDIATALQAYQGTVTGDAATLAAAAGTLLTAYVTCMTAVQTALAQRLHDDATARHDFWVTVEGLLDAT